MRFLRGREWHREYNFLAIPANGLYLAHLKKVIILGAKPVPFSTACPCNFTDTAQNYVLLEPNPPSPITVTQVKGVHSMGAVSLDDSLIMAKQFGSGRMYRSVSPIA